MSRMGQWVMEMQESAAQMTLQEFVEQYGQSQTAVWFEVNGGFEDVEPDVIQEEFEYYGA